MPFASIDIGSNTTLLLIVEKNDDQTLRVLEDHSRVTGLGRDVQKTKMLSTVAMEETFNTLADYVNICKKYGIDLEQCFATATEASRIAQNSKDFFQSIKDKLNLSVNIISSEKEAFFTARGVSTFDHQADSEKMTIMDIGGASTEFINVRTSPFRMQASVSLPLGSVVCHEWFLQGDFNTKIEDVLEQFDLSPYECSSITCVAGSMTAIAGMMRELDQFDVNLINGYKVSLSDFEAFVDRLDRLTVSDLEKRYPFLEKRSVTIKAGARLALRLCQKVKAHELRISTYGLRHGSVLESIHE